MSKQQHQNKHQRQAEKQLAPQNKEVPLAEVIEKLKSEILKEIRQVSSGIKASIYELIEMDKELEQLEAEQAKAGQAADVKPEDF